VTDTRPRLAAVAVIAWLGLAACGAGEPPAPVDAPADTPPERPPAMAEEKMTLARQVLAAKADLAQRLGVSADEIEVVEAREVTWPDTALGCPEPGMMYAQVLTPGVLVAVRADGTTAYYLGSRASVPILCPDDRFRSPVEQAAPRER